MTVEALCFRSSEFQKRSLRNKKGKTKSSSRLLDVPSRYPIITVGDHDKKGNTASNKLILQITIVFLSVVAAATEYYYDCKDDSPGAVIVEKMAKTVVHKVCSSGCLLWRLPSLIFIVCIEREEGYKVRDAARKNKKTP